MAVMVVLSFENIFFLQLSLALSLGNAEFSLGGVQ